MTGDNVAKVPTLDEQMATFKGFSTENGEVADPSKENLNPVTKGVSVEEAAAGATLIEEQPVELTEGEEGADKTKTADAAKTKAGEQKKDAPVPPGVQKRINDAVRKQRAAERESTARATELQELKERMARLEGSALTAKGQGATSDDDDDPNAPKATAYEYGELDPKFIRDLARYEAKKEFEASQKKQDTQRKTAAQSSEQKELMAKAHAFEEAGIGEYDDFEEVVIEGARANLWELTPTVGELILDSEVGHKVAYYLASNPKEASTVAKMKPLAATKWFARKEDEFSAEASAATGKEPPKGSERPAQLQTQAKTLPKAPPPPANRARGGTGTASVSADTTDFAAFEAMNAGQSRSH